MGTRRIITIGAIASLALAAAACAPPPPAPGLTPGCYDSAGIANDVEYIGPIDTYGNINIWSSDDGTCTGTSSANTWISSPDNPSADAECIAINPGYFEADHMSTVPYQYPVPADIYGCLPTGV